MRAMVGDALLGGSVATVAEAVARMQAIEAALDPADGLFHFNRMYQTR